MAQRRFTPEQSALIGTLYLLNPALHGVNSYDFHVQAFIPLILNYLVYYTYKADKLGILLASNLALAVQEQVFYLILAFIVFLVLKSYLNRFEGDARKQLSLILLVLLSALLWRFASGQVIHYYNPEIPDHLKAGQHFAVLGALNPSDIPLHVILNLGSALRALVFQWYDKLVYLLSHFTPYLFLFSQVVFLLIPTVSWFAISLLSNYPPYYRIGFQYSAYIIPFTFNSFIIGRGKEFDSCTSFTKNRKLRLMSLLVIVTSLALSPLSPLTKGST